MSESHESTEVEEEENQEERDMKGGWELKQAPLPLATPSLSTADSGESLRLWLGDE